MRIIYVCLLLLFMQLALAESVEVDDYTIKADGKVYSVPNTESNISVLLLQSLEGAEIHYKSHASTTTPHEWLRYHFNTGDSEPVACQQEGSTSWIEPENGDYGYYVKTATSQHYIWIIDYNQYSFYFKTISVDDVPDMIDDGDDTDTNKCEYVTLKLDMNVPSLTYYLSTGGGKTVRRGFCITYNTQEWSDEKKSYLLKETKEVVESWDEERMYPAPLTDTHFTLEMDEIARYFGAEDLKTEEEYRAIAVGAKIIAEQIERDSDKNTTGGEGDSFGGSAPVEMEFTAYGSDAVNGYRWKVHKKEDYPGMGIARGDKSDFDYTFKYWGDYYVELEVVNADVSCTYKPELISVNITESFLKIPNVFSPGTTPGKNDVFKVSYQSLIKFKGVIFSRWGVKVFEWNSPDEGWDGKYNGRYVPSGVYYYIIEAEGSEGVKYHKKGDINLLRPKDINDEIYEDSELQ